MALRTLRQVPKVVSTMPGGETIFEAKSVRLVLHGDAHHFNRLVVCAKCGREVPGPPVLSPADLDHAPHAVVCGDCVTGVTRSVAPTGEFRALPESPPSVAAELAPAVDVCAGATDTEIATLASEVTQLARDQQELGRALDNAVARLQELADGARATVDGGGGLAMEEVNRRLTDLAERVTLDAVAGGVHLDATEHRLRRMEAGIEAAAAEAGSGLAATARTESRQVGIEAQFAATLHRVETQAAEAAQAAAQSAQAAQAAQAALSVAASVAEADRVRALDSLAQQVAAGRLLEAMDRRLRERDDDMSELIEFQAVLDVGMGTLRSEIAELRGALGRLAQNQAEMHDRGRHPR